ncbi:MAG: FAD-binding oxidoreductase [Nanoarchaeota archaeon]
MTKTTKNKIVYEENILGIKGKALAIVFPETLQEIKTLIKLSHQDIIPRGSGTSFTGALIPKNSVIIDFSKMNEIIEVNPTKKTAVVQPGVLLSELNEELEQYGLEFPIEPVFGGIETIGGIIAKNSSGNREIKYNRAINWIDSLEVISSKGEQHKISKSDLSDYVGMEGITGIIVRASIRLTIKKQRTMTILKSDKLEDIFAASKRLRMNPEVSAIDLISREVATILGLENRHHLFIEFESDSGTFKGENYEKYVKLKNKAYKKMAQEGFSHIENIKFLIDSLQDFLIHLEENRIPHFSHMASGVVYPLFRTDAKEPLKLEEAMKLTRRLRGRVGYNLGIGIKNKEFLEVGEAELTKRVKNRLDPSNKLNRDKVISIKFAEELLKRKEERAEAKFLPEIKQEKTEEKQEKSDLPQEPKPLTVGDILNSETMTLKKPEQEQTPEEKEKIRKIASGFFAGGRDTKEGGNL